MGKTPNQKDKKTAVIAFKGAKYRKYGKNDLRYQKVEAAFWFHAARDLQMILGFYYAKQGGADGVNYKEFAKRLSKFRQHQEDHPSAADPSLDMVFLMLQSCAEDDAIEHLFSAQELLVEQACLKPGDAHYKDFYLLSLPRNTSSVLDYFVEEWITNDKNRAALAGFKEQYAGEAIANLLQSGDVIDTKFLWDKYVAVAGDEVNQDEPENAPSSSGDNVLKFSPKPKK